MSDLESRKEYYEENIDKISEQYQERLDNTELLEKYRSSIVTYTKRCLSREYLLHPDYRVNEPYKSVYVEKWSKRTCIEGSHDLLFKRQYGVIGWCQSCDITQCFNLSHPIN